MKQNYKFFELEQIEGNVAILYLNKPEKRNSMDWDFWFELPNMIEEINSINSIYSFVIAGKGKSFSVGLDLSNLLDEKFRPFIESESGDARLKFYEFLKLLQKGLIAIYESPKPSIAAIHKHCIGGGLDLIAACDLRYCTKDAVFSLREAKVGIVADMGSLNHLPGIIGMGNTKELALTGKDIGSEEALKINLVNRVLESNEELMEHSLKVAKEIATNPKIVTEGIKKVLNYSAEHSIKESLDHVALWNSSFMISKDFRVGLDAIKNKKIPKFNLH